MTATRALTLATTLTLLAAPPTPAAAQQFRGGPARVGVYADPGPAAGAAVTWRVQTGGSVRSTPVVTAAAVLVGSGDGALHALDRGTGALRWSYHAGSPVAGSPAVAGDRVVVTTRSGGVHAVSGTTGAALWTVEGEGTALLPGGWDYWVPSPLITGDRVVVARPGGTLEARSLETGAVEWRYETGAPLRASPALSDGRVVIGDAAGVVHAVALRDGSELWRHETEGVGHTLEEWGFDRSTVQATPAIRDGRVYVGSRDGGLYALELETGRRLWRADFGFPWVVASVAAGPGRLYVGSSDGLWVRALDPATGELLWEADVDARVFASPALSPGALYVADHGGRVLALDPATGRTRWSLPLARQIQASPVPAGPALFVGADDGAVYRLDPAPTPHRAVFWDSALARTAVQPGGRLLKDYLAALGWSVLDGEALPVWLRDRAAGAAPAVVVFALDRLPDALTPGTPSEPGLLRRYLDAGGSAVWTGFPPWALVRDSTGRAVRIDHSLHQQALGIDLSGGVLGEYGAIPTAEGRARGLAGPRLSAAAIAPGTGVTALARDELGRIAAAVRSYGGPEGTGLIVLWGLGAHPESLAGIRAVAEHAVRGGAPSP